MSSSDAKSPLTVFVVTNIFEGDLQQEHPTIHPVFLRLSDAQKYVKSLYISVREPEHAKYDHLFAEVNGCMYFDLEIEYDPALDLAANNEQNDDMEDHDKLYIHATELR